MEEKKLYNAVRKEITLADGRVIEIETGKLAKQADGAVVVKMGGTMLLGTVVAAKDAKPDTDFMPQIKPGPAISTFSISLLSLFKESTIA